MTLYAYDKFNNLKPFNESSGGGGITSNAIYGSRTVALTNSTAIPNLNVPRTRVRWTISGGRHVLTLPAFGPVRVGAEFEVTLIANAGRGGVVAPSSGTLDSVTSNSSNGLSRVGDTMIIRRTPDGYVSFNNGLWLHSNLEVVTVDPALGAAPGWRGLRPFRTNYGAAGDFTLPTAPMEGTHLRVSRVTASAAVTLQAGGNTIVSAGAAGSSLSLVVEVPVDLIYSGTLWTAAA